MHWFRPPDRLSRRYALAARPDSHRRVIRRSDFAQRLHPGEVSGADRWSRSYLTDELGHHRRILVGPLRRCRSRNKDAIATLSFLTCCTLASFSPIGAGKPAPTTGEAVIRRTTAPRGHRVESRAKASSKTRSGPCGPTATSADRRDGREWSASFRRSP
jgi:hypothetical protein